MSAPRPDLPPERSSPATVALVLTLGTAVAVLYGLSWVVRTGSCAWIVGTALIASSPLWYFRTRRALLRRQAILDSVGRETSGLVQRFRRGLLTQFGLGFIAFGLTMALLVILARLGPLDWAILAANAVLVGLLFNWTRRSLAGHIKEAHQGLIARIGPVLWGNALLLTLTFVAVDFVSSHTLIQGSWLEVIDEAFSRGRQGITCPGLGVLSGVINVVEQLSWKAAVGALPQLPDMPTKLIGWGLFLAWTGFGAVVFTQFLLGVVALVDDYAGKRAGGTTGQPLWRSFFATIVVLAAVSLFAEWKLSQWTFQPGTVDVSALLTGTLDPCAAVGADADAIRAALNGDIDQARLEAYRQADRQIDNLLDQAFGKAEQGVDGYLDWYFSLYGDYSRLAAVMVGDLGQVMHDNLSKHVFDGTGFAQLIEAGTPGIQQVVTAQMTNMVSRLPEQVRQAVDIRKCSMPTVDLTALVNLDQDRVRAAVSTTTAIAVGGVTAKTLGKKAAVAAASKAAASGSVKMAAKIAGKAVAKKGVSTAAAAGIGTMACAAAGPIAIACGIAAGVFTWVAVDKAVIEVEELVSRDAMRADVLKALAEQRAAMETQLQGIYHAMADAYAREIQARADKVFVPARDGL